MMDTKEDQRAYQRLLKHYSKGQLGRFCGITKQAVTRWQAVPLKYVTTISKATGVPRADLRPSDYG